MTTESVITLLYQSNVSRDLLYSEVVMKLLLDGYVSIRWVQRIKWGSKEKMKSESEATCTRLKSVNLDDLMETDYVTNSKGAAFFRSIIQMAVWLSFEEYQGEFSSQIGSSIIESIVYDYLKINYGLDVSITSGYVHTEDIRIVEIDGISEFINTMSDYSIESSNMKFFRGHDDANYIMLPSVMRNYSSYENESYYYNEIIRQCPSYFSRMVYHIDYLAEMQHYEIPTRLLDVSRNALIGLAFACMDRSKLSIDGEVVVFSIPNRCVKHGDSDTITLISCLSRFSTDEKEELRQLAERLSENEDENERIASFNSKKAVLRFLQEVKREKPAFRDAIDPRDLRKSLITMPSMLNQRILKQSGAFAICGLFGYDERNAVAESINIMRLRTKQKITPIFIINSKAKRKVTQQLEMCDITEAALFPEIDRVARFIKESAKTRELCRSEVNKGEEQHDE